MSEIVDYYSKRLANRIATGIPLSISEKQYWLRLSGLLDAFRDPAVKFDITGTCDISELTKGLENIRTQMGGLR